MKNWTGERLETFVYNRIAIEHLHRYAITNNYIKGKIILDIASGEGYGAALMSKEASFVYGVDIDKEAISKAKLKYTQKNIEFLEGSTNAIPLDDNTIDVVISFETIEHHDEHDKMMLEIKRVLKPDGIVIISTPDKLYYSEERNLLNEFHVKELYKHEFKNLINNYFNHQQLLTQLYNNGNSIIQNDIEKNNLMLYYGNYLSIKNRAVKPMFLISIASDFEFEKHDLSIFDGGYFVKNELMAEFRGSNTYKIGHLVLLPIKYLKRIFK
ncbi:class I SAM-dependent methyltransferase [Flavobacterium sp. CFBP9031]|uniref:class I SAM-dependent methyltransferase n=1 Tax=Flavobacterium sp. CFBP9031 TaxID=3096538 RepID=UPI002A6A86D4|nr:class I SAM-dependent methyltransferase [Flavobacterium sp. CFBP9031]MDY0987411.1 class I SAM-dependent methyltransferase [Flavobacterium sp. CFBP9031]